MTQPDIRWIQRFSNFKKDFVQLKEAVELSILSDLREPALLEHIGRAGVPLYEKAPYKK